MSNSKPIDLTTDRQFYAHNFSRNLIQLNCTAKWWSCPSAKPTCVCGGEADIQSPRSAIPQSGGADRDRTDDLKLAKLALSQLSYSPKGKTLSSAARNGGPGKI